MTNMIEELIPEAGDEQPTSPEGGAAIELSAGPAEHEVADEPAVDSSQDEGREDPPVQGEPGNEGQVDPDNAADEFSAALGETAEASSAVPSPGQGEEERPATFDQGAQFEYLKLGDSQRDQGNWSAAAESYKKHLETDPLDLDRWLQLGNCLFEGGEFDDALAAYGQATEINPRNADPYILRGHVLKRMGKLKQAIETYTRGYELDNTRLEARLEIIGLGGKLLVSGDVIARSESDAHTRTLYLDINDFFFYLRHHMNVSGIQRVIANIAEEIINNDDGEIRTKVRFIVTTGDPLALLEVSPFNVMRVILLTKKHSTTRSELNLAISECYANAKKAQTRPGDMYIVLGAFWVSPYYERLLVDLRERGVAIGVYVYDLIPLVHRNLTVEDLWRMFSRRMIEIMSLSDFMLTISEYVAGEVRQYLTETLGLDTPVRAVPLAQELEDPKTDEMDLGDAVREITADPFVLCVGTIEIRKNHQYLINLWRELVAERGEAAPNLVLVGRWGWMIDGLKQQLEATNYLEGKVIIVDEVNDAELSHLYRSCLFTVFPSLIEGWGLPVGESLAYGKPCIASHATSIPEVGGDFVRYIDPHDLASGRREIARVLNDPDDLAAWAKRIREEFTPRTWAHVAAKLCRDAEELAPQELEGRRRAYYHLQPGEIVEVGDEARNREIKSDPRTAAAALLRIDGWHPAEGWGCWSKHRKSTLRFIVDAPKGARIGVALLVRTPTGSPNAALTVRSGSLVTNVALHNSPTLRWHFAKAEVEEDGVVDLALRCTGEFPVPPTDSRSLFVGLGAVGCYVEGHVEQRMDLLQSIILS